MVHSSMPVHWRLREYLSEKGITVYRLSEESGVPKNTLYNLTNKKPARIDLTTLNAVLPALERLTGSPVELTELLKYERA